MIQPAITGTARLDNRDELFRALGMLPADRARVSDLMLALAAYQRWGDRCPERLLGDFAFVISDPATGAAFGARDHLGVVPFYYRVNGARLEFALRASELPARDGRPLELDEARIADVLLPQLECVDATSTLYRAVRRLPAGHRLAFSEGHPAVSRYWTPEPSPPGRAGSDADHEEAFREVFAEAVRCRLPGAAASMLSGGLDSSAVVGFARKIRRSDGRPALTTLSAVTDDEGCEESRYIRSVLTLDHLDPVRIGPDDVKRFRPAVEEFVDSLEEPFDDAMVIPLLLYKSARDRGFDAVLDGVDGDVVASVEPDVLERLLRHGRWRRAFREARGIARFYSGTYDPWSSTARLLGASAVRALMPASTRRAIRGARHDRSVREAVGASMIHPDFASRIGVSDRLRSLADCRDDGLLHPRIGAALERYFRVAATQGVEPRHPFLDRRVVDLCRALPWDIRLRDGWSKWIVRRASSGLLPEDVIWRRGRWVRLGPRFLEAVVMTQGELVRRELEGSWATLAPYVDLPRARAVYERHRCGDRGTSETVWKLAVLSSWLRKFAAKRYDAAARANGLAALPCLPFAG